jgi:Rps23 Pro-64 3,4-dihydroxylase Tpa1-like proline 4-hydroxylase
VSNLVEQAINQDHSQYVYRRTTVPSSFLERNQLFSIAEERALAYRSAKPFAHTVIDGLFPAELLDQVVAEIPAQGDGWRSYDTRNELKTVCSDVSAFGPTAECLGHALNSDVFVRFLEQLSGFEALLTDPSLHASGYMRCERGGFLDLHYDFTGHTRLPLKRCLNVLVYLNRDWRPEWGGQLELHSNDDLSDPRHQEVLIEPLFNRTVIFSTEKALHGHRRPVACPVGRSRLLFSAFYYTTPPVLGFRADADKVRFPGDRSLKAKAIHAANKLVPPVVFNLLGRRARAAR